LIRSVAIVVAILSCAFALPARAQDMAVPPDVQYSLFVRILTFDRALQKRDHDKIVIGVLYQKGVQVSLQAKDDFLAAVAQSNIKEVFGRPIECIPLGVDGANLATRTDSAGIDVLYVTPVRAFDIAKLVTEMASAKILTLTGVPDYVEAGVAIGIGSRGDKPMILVNLQQAKNQGANLSAQLLHLATIVE
jgi:hypothetical protein